MCYDRVNGEKRRAEPARRRGVKGLGAAVNTCPSPGRELVAVAAGTRMASAEAGSVAYERRVLGIGSQWPFDQWGRFLPEQVNKARRETRDQSPDVQMSFGRRALRRADLHVSDELGGASRNGFDVL